MNSLRFRLVRLTGRASMALFSAAADRYDPRRRKLKRPAGTMILVGNLLTAAGMVIAHPSWFGIAVRFTRRVLQNAVAPRPTGS